MTENNRGYTDMMTSREIVAEREVNGVTVCVARCAFKDEDGYNRVDYVVEDDFDNYDVFKTKGKAVRYLNNL